MISPRLYSPITRRRSSITTARSVITASHGNPRPSITPRRNSHCRVPISPNPVRHATSTGITISRTPIAGSVTSQISTACRIPITRLVNSRVTVQRVIVSMHGNPRPSITPRRNSHCRAPISPNPVRRATSTGITILHTPTAGSVTSQISTACRIPITRLVNSRVTVQRVIVSMHGNPRPSITPRRNSHCRAPISPNPVRRATSTGITILRTPTAGSVTRQISPAHRIPITPPDNSHTTAPRVIRSMPGGLRPSITPRPIFRCRVPMSHSPARPVTSAEITSWYIRIACSATRRTSTQP